MQTFKNVVVLGGKIANLLDIYTKEFRQNGQGFEDFSDEAIVYALLEYSKFPRKYTPEERIEYIHGKCLEYHDLDHYYVKVEFDPQYDCFMVLRKQVAKPNVKSLGNIEASFMEDHINHMYEENDDLPF
jgi:hypothetical protein